MNTCLTRHHRQFSAMGATIVLSIFLSIKVDAGQSNDLKILRTVKSWQIRAEKDAMTDKLSCVAYYNGNPAIQLNADAFYISLSGRGGVKGITLRFDDKPANPLRLPDDIEKQLGIVRFTPSEFDELLQAKRVRVQVLTVLSNVVLEDVNLRDINLAMAVLNGSDCSAGK